MTIYYLNQTTNQQVPLGYSGLLLPNTQVSNANDATLRLYGFLPINKAPLLVGQEYGIPFSRQGADGLDELYYPAVWAINPETGVQFADEQEAIGYYNSLKVYDRQEIIELFPANFFGEIALIAQPNLPNFDPEIFVFWQMLQMMERFKLSDVRLIAGVNKLVEKNKLTQEQAQAVLRGEKL